MQQLMHASRHSSLLVYDETHGLCTGEPFSQLEPVSAFDFPVGVTGPGEVKFVAPSEITESEQGVFECEWQWSSICSQNMSLPETACIPPEPGVEGDDAHLRTMTLHALLLNSGSMGDSVE